MEWTELTSQQRSGALTGLTYRITRTTISLSPDACNFLGERVRIVQDGNRIGFLPAEEGVGQRILWTGGTAAGQIVNRHRSPLRHLPSGGPLALHREATEGYGDALVGDLPLEV
ncbi:hypothetical protein LCGC14_0312950 [marine sediment metagenome]|uniref:Uncharacterized protein n=1 Tax=marine sediment metagenome TaxID=412755 RepID=A0A0F9WT74_9ZZZZ